MYYLNIFFIYSILGFIFETTLCSIISPGFSSGVLYGPWTFIYGLAIFLIMGIDKFLKRFKLKKWLEIILFYLTVTIIVTILEFSGGMLIEKLFHMVYWDYIKMKLNFGFYICLEVSLIWGLFATFINYVVKDKISTLAKRIPKFITVIALILFIADCVITFINKV